MKRKKKLEYPRNLKVLVDEETGVKLDELCDHYLISRPLVMVHCVNAMHDALRAVANGQICDEVMKMELPEGMHGTEEENAD